ncbi:hypothetical protein MMC29_001349 [Sticta canariensis]|nr:hypothetical protein [Sticta canariensis]
MSRYAAAHAKPEGEGDSRPSALQIVQDEGLVNRFIGKVMIVTGCSAGDFQLNLPIHCEPQQPVLVTRSYSSGYGCLLAWHISDGLKSARALLSFICLACTQNHVLSICQAMLHSGCCGPVAGGIGIETARALHATGADIFVTLRDQNKGEAVVEDIRSKSQGKGKVELLLLELDSFKSVRAAAEGFLRRSKTLNVIVNNAGMTATEQTAWHIHFGYEHDEQLSAEIDQSHRSVQSRWETRTRDGCTGTMPNQIAECYLQPFVAAVLAITNPFKSCVASIMSCPEGRTQDGFETQFGTCHLGHFLLFELLKPTLLASSTPGFNSRVVSVSSLGHRASPVLFDDLDFKKSGYQPGKAYGQAKTANIWFALEIERRYGPHGLHATTLHPGGIWTPLQKFTPGVKEQYKDNAPVQKYMKSVEQGAATSVYAAVSKDWEGRGGKYLENCAESVAHDGSGMDGYAPHAYDAAAAQRLWDLSLKLVGQA